MNETDGNQNKIYGYVRVSTRKQSIERQIKNIKERYPESIIIKEIYTGTYTNRPAWKKLNKHLKPGDTIIFDSVSRMSRDENEGFQTYQELYNKKIRLIFLKEPHINTDTYKKAITQEIPMTGKNIDLILDGINKYLLAIAREQIKITFAQAEKEVNDLRQRTKEGIENARLNGKQIGHPKGTTFETQKSKKCKEIILKRSKNFNGELKDTEIMKITGIAPGTYYKYKKELKQALA